MNPIIVDDGEESNATAGEEILTDRRGKPVPPERIYLEEASLHRPTVTRDIFGIDDIAGTANEANASSIMVTSHPSGMRSGPALEEYVRAAPVVVDERLSARRANVRTADLFPLPRLTDFFHGDDSLEAVRLRALRQETEPRHTMIS
jgi:hypothetical protein